MPRKEHLSSRETRAFLKKNQLSSARSSAFAFRDQAVGRRYGFHAHARHQLLYAETGTASLEVANATYLLPPQRAGFVPAGVEHATSMGNAQGISLFFDERLIKLQSDEVRVVEVTPLLREMIRFAQRWPASRPAT